MVKSIYTWDPDTFEAGCILSYKDKTFVGYAVAHPDDQDLAGELTGCNIAELRANIALLQYRRDCEIIPGLNALKQLYYSMKHSKQYNQKAYESKMLYRQIKIFEEDLQENKKLINTLREELKTYIDEKDNRYKKIRQHRAKNIQLSLFDNEDNLN